MISAVLSVVMAISLLVPQTPRVSAAESLKTSDQCIALIKEFEGFLEYAAYDYKQYTIGYGSSCEKDDYPNGITEEEADRLLREDLAQMEEKLDNFAQEFGLNLSQRQYDALMSFTYNLGYGWMSSPSTLRSAITEQKTGNDLIFALTMWCNAGGQISTGLVQRRLSEANMYLNGVYSRTVPANYRYVIFDNNMDDAVSDVKIQGYDANQPDSLRAKPAKEGYRFLGWYTKASGGAWVTGVDGNTGNVTLYGHWQQDGISHSDAVSASYIRYASAKQKLYTAPGGDVKKTYQGGEKLTVTADYLDDAGVKWGKISAGGWVKLSESRETAEEDQGETVNMTVTVSRDGVNIRSGPGTNYSKVGVANKGKKLAITKVQQGGTYLWGKFSDGWICLKYTDYDQVKNEETVAIVGKIIGTDRLNVRSAPGTSNARVGYLYRNDIVDISKLQKVGSTTWGKTDKGWISMKYVDQNPTGTEGVVIECTGLSVRSGPGTNYARLDILEAGTKVTILATKTVDGMKWGRIRQGWVSMNYIRLAGEANPEPEKLCSVGMIIGTDTLRVRSAAGTQNKQVGTLLRGDKIVILETAKVGSATWARFEKGWVHMYYVEVTATKVPETAVVRTVTGDVLRIRSGAGTNYSIVGSYVQGTQVVILEKKTVSGVVWGRTDKGWISMDYVK